MTDLYLKFNDQQHAHEILHDFTYVTDDNTVKLMTSTLQYALHEVGHILNTGGWHINLRILDDTLDITFLEEYQVYPKTPGCVWA